MASSTVSLYTFYAHNEPNISASQVPILTTLLTVPIITVSENEPFTTLHIRYLSQTTGISQESLFVTYTTIIDLPTSGTSNPHFATATIDTSTFFLTAANTIGTSATDTATPLLTTPPSGTTLPYLETTTVEEFILVPFTEYSIAFATETVYAVISETQPSKALSGGALAGITVGTVAVIAVLLLAGFIIHRRKISRRKFRKQSARRTGDIDANVPVSKGGNERFEKPELPNQELPRTHGRAELDSARPPIPGTVSSISNKAELPSDMHDEIHELAPGSSQLEGTQSSRTHVGSGTSAGGPLDDSTRDSQHGYGEQTSSDMLNASPSIRHDGPARSDTPPETITTSAEAEPARQQPEPATQQPEPFDYSTWGVM